MVRTAGGQYFAAQHLDVLVHEDVVDLAVRPMRGIGAAEHRSLPTREESHDCRPPEVEVAGDHRGPTVGRQLRADGAHVRDRPGVPELRRRVQPDDVDGRSPDATRCTRARCATSGMVTEHLADRQLAPVADGQPACRPRAPNLRRAGRHRGATCATPGGRSASCAPSSPRLRAGRGDSFHLRNATPPAPRRCRRRTRVTIAATSNRRARSNAQPGRLPNAR